MHTVYDKSTASAALETHVEVPKENRISGEHSPTGERDVLRSGAVDAAREPSFDVLGLSDEVLAAVRDLGYVAPTPVQKAAIPEVLAGRDLLAAAQTGTGKTAAFLLPAMSRLGHVVPRGKHRRGARGRGPLMLVVTPTRELAQQIEEVCMRVAEHTGHVAATVVGGVGYNPQRSALKNGCDILVATPGRLVDLLGEGTCNLSEVRVLVLDEADRMLDMGFLPDVRRIVDATPDDRQTLLFSATLDEKAVGTVTDLVSDPARVEIAPPQSTAETVDQYLLPVSSEAKNALLADVLRREGAQRVIVFTRTKHRADACCRRLARAGIRTAPIHGNRTQAQRERALKAFRTGEVDVLVATDVLSRGIDITDVRYVVNFDVPSDPTDYIHRIGRTGRAGEEGWALTFVTELDVQEFYDIEALMGKTAELFDVEGLDQGMHAPVIDPARVPASRGKKKTHRGKSTSRKRRGGANGRGGSGAASGGHGAASSHRAERSGGEGASSGVRSPRPARPKRAGRARVREADAPERMASTSKSADHAAGQSSSENRGNRTRRDAGTKCRRASAATRGTDDHDWRNSDYADDRRARGERRRRGGASDANGRVAAGGRRLASGRDARQARRSGTRRPGDHGGRGARR